MTLELVGTDIEPSITSGVVGGTADCELGLGVACNAFSPTDTACDKVVLTVEFVMSGVESDISVG